MAIQCARNWSSMANASCNEQARSTKAPCAEIYNIRIRSYVYSYSCMKRPYQAEAIGRDEGVVMDDRAWTCRLRLQRRSSLDVWTPFSMSPKYGMYCFEKACKDFGHAVVS